MWLLEMLMYKEGRFTYGATWRNFGDGKLEKVCDFAEGASVGDIGEGMENES